MAMSVFSVGPKNAGAPPLEVTADNVQGTAAGFSLCGSVSSAGDSPNTTPSGGTPPYTYSWTNLDTATAGPFTPSSSTAQNPTWSDTRCANHADNTETWEVTVTDANSNTATDTITVLLFWSDLR